MQGHEELVLNQEIRDARILEKTKILSEFTEQRDILQGRMAETHTSKEEEAYQNILNRIAEIEADLREEERVVTVGPLALNTIPPHTHRISPAAIDIAVSTPEEYKDEEIQDKQSIESISASEGRILTSFNVAEEAYRQTDRKLLDDKQALQSLENLIKRLHQLFINDFKRDSDDGVFDSRVFDLYIEPQVKDRDTGAEFSAFERLGDFVVQAGAASMLVAGDPGMGKTLLSLQIARQSWYVFIRENIGNFLKDSYWSNVLDAYEQQGFAQIAASLFPEVEEKSEAPTPEKNISLPLWLWMPSLRTERNWEEQLLEAHFAQKGILPEEVLLLKQACQQRILRIFPIMDGWDELPPVKENLYLLNGFWEEEHWPYLKVLSTCRPEAFIHYEKQGGYKSIFHPRPGAGSYTILNLSPFEPRHIDAYIRRYVSTLPEDYQPQLSIPLSMELSTGQAKAWDREKAIWLADYEANYLPLQNAPKAAAAEFVNKKEETANVDLLSPWLNMLDMRNDEEEVAAAFALFPNEQSTNWLSVQSYQYYLENISGLQQLIQTPFVLSAVMQVLPSIVMHHSQYREQSQQTITRYTIYQYFVDYWLATQAKRLWRDKEKQLDLIDFRMENEAQSIEKLKACLFTYSENLARLALNLGGGKFEVNFSDQDTLNSNLVIPASGPPHFEKEEVEIKKLQHIRSGCLLQNLGNTFKFLHKSLVEFFAAKTLFSGAHIAADSYLQRFGGMQSFLKDLTLNEQLLTSEPNIIRLLGDQARGDLDFKYILYQIIELSKVEPSVEKAAANAITILNVAGEPFSGRDFRGIHIRGAILNGALCDQTDFEGADLRDVRAHNAWLQKANLSRAQVLGLDFQELPRVKHSTMIVSFCIASNSKWLLIGDGKGYVTQYGYPEGKQLRQWNLNSRKISFLALHPDEKLTAASYNGGVQLIDIQSDKLGAFFRPQETASEDGKLLREGWAESYEFNCTCTNFCHTRGQYLVVGVQVNFIREYSVGAIGPHGDYDFTEKFKRVEYSRQHLQLWNIEQHRFLGEYVADCYILFGHQRKLVGQFEQLSTSHQGHILIAKTGENILLFSLLDYKQGPLVPEQRFCSSTPFALSRDEQRLGVSQKNIIQLYQTGSWELLPNIIQLKEEQECKALAFNYEGTLLVVRSSAQLYIWDLSSGQELYNLPIPVANNSRFFLSTDISHVFILLENSLYIRPLDRDIVRIHYPYQPINLPTPLLVNIKAHSKLYTDSLSIESSNDRKVTTLQIFYKQTKEIKILSYGSHWFWGSKEAGKIPILLLSVDQAYLVSIIVDSQYNEKKNRYVRVWDLQKYCLQSHFKIKYSASPDYLDDCLLSNDGQWLVSALGREIFIHCLKDGKNLTKFASNSFSPCFYRHALPFVLSANKHWLAVADYNQCLSIFDVVTQKCSFYLRELPIFICKLNCTSDNQYLIAEGEKDKDGTLIFRVLQKKEGIVLRLVKNTIKLNLVCGEINMEAARDLSRDNQLLLTQSHAHGTPAPVAAVAEDKQSEQDERIDIAREFSFDHAVVRRDDVSSFLNPRAGLNYDLWQVALVRDAQSKSNSEHTFIVVEGMDAFGRSFFWRFDLATRVGDTVVEKGFAKVTIQRYNDLLLSEREGILQVFLNPHEIQGRGLESLVGHVWQLKRGKVLDLYRAAMTDQAKGLLPYAITGNQSFFATGDNCYSWARRHLLALKEPKIKQDLPSSRVDYFLMRPKWKLQESLAADQQVRSAGQVSRSCQLM